MKLRATACESLLVSTLCVGVSAGPPDVSRRGFAIEPPNASETTAGSPADRSPTDRLLVVAPESFREVLAEFRRERERQLGAPVEFLALEAVAPEGVAPEDVAPEEVAREDSTGGGDAPERLKHELFRRWKDGRMTAVLLVGDADIMPVRFMKLDRVTEPAFDTAFYPSDLYYADLAREDGTFDDWNAAKEGVHARYFGEVHGERNKAGPINFDRVSYTPEIAVGRWPVSTPDEARAVARKTIRHQDALRAAVRAPAEGAAQTAETNETAADLRFFFSGGWIDNRERATSLVSRVGARGSWTTDMHAFFTPGREPTIAAVAAALSEKPAAIFHTGHGQPWGWEGCFDRATMLGAPACDLPPFFFSIGCSTAVVCTQPPYDGYVDVDGRAHKGTNAGEVFTELPPPPAPLQPGACNASSTSEEAVRRADGGAIAVIGCVTGSQPCAHTLLDGFVDAMARDPEASAGRWWMDAMTRYVRDERLMELEPTESWYPPSIFFQGMKFIYLGDPTVRLRRAG